MVKKEFTCMKFLQQHPIFLPLISAIFGIFCGFQINFNISFFLFCVLSTLFWCALILLSHKVEQYTSMTDYLGCLFIVFLFFALINTCIVQSGKNNSTQATASTYLIKPTAIIKKKGEMISLKAKYSNSSTWSKDYILLHIGQDLYTSHPQAEQLIVYGKKFLPSPPILKGEFDYNAYLNHRNISAVIYSKEENTFFPKNQKSSKLNLWLITAVIHNYLNKFLKQHFKNNTIAWINTSLTGDDHMMSQQLIESARSLGIAHLFCVSGFHVGLIFMIIRLIFFSIPISKKNKNRLLFINSLWILTLYISICQFSPSVVRACVMLWIYQFARLIRPKSSQWQHLFLSAFILLLIDPTFLFEIGFQLSYSAVISILITYPYLNKHFINKLNSKLIRYLSSLLGLSLAAQIGVLPISIYYFHQLPTLFLFSNLLIIPLFSLFMLEALILVPLSAIGFMTHYCSQALNTTVYLIEKVTYVLLKIPIQQIQGIYLSTVMVLIWLLIYFLIIIWHKKASPNKVIVLVCMFYISISFSYLTPVSEYGEQKIELKGKLIHIFFYNRKATIVLPEGCPKNNTKIKPYLTNWKTKYNIQNWSIFHSSENNLDTLSQCFKFDSLVFVSGRVFTYKKATPSNN